MAAVPLSQYRATTQIASRAWMNTFSVDSGFTYGNTASHVLDTTKYVDGTGSIQVVGTAGTACEIELNNVSFTSSTGKWGFRFYVHDYTRISLIALYLSRDTSYTNFALYTYNINSIPALQKNGWHVVEFTDGDSNLAFTGGTFSLTSTIQRYKLRVTSLASVQATVNWDAIWYDGTSRPAVMITADDGYLTWSQDGISVLDTYGIKSTNYIIPGRLDTGGLYDTKANILAAYANGHDIQVHGDNALSGYSSQALVEAEVLLNKRGVEALIGRVCEHYCYPNGVYESSAGDTVIKDALINLGFKTARTVEGLTTSTGRNFTPYEEPFIGGVTAGPFTCPELLRLPIIGHDGTYVNDTPANILARIDAAIKRRTSCILMFHKIGSGGTALEVTAADFATIVEGIYKRMKQGLIDVPTVSQWYKSLTQPTIAN